MFPLKLGVVGPGIMWRDPHKVTLQAMPDEFQITAFSARSAPSREAFRADFPKARFFEHYEELARSPEVDALVVTTPIPLNGPVTLAGLRAGKHVFVEKPFATSTAQACEIMEAEKNSRGRVFILENLLYTPRWDEVKTLLDGRRLGDFAMFDRVSHGFMDMANDPYGFANTAWRVDSGFPLGPLFDGGIHEVALMQQLFGRPQSVYATGQNWRPEHGEYDLINMLFGYRGGQTGCWSFSSLLGGRQNHFVIRCTEGLIVFDYYRCTLQWRDGREETLEFAPDAGAFFKGLNPAMWKKFADCLRTGEAPPYTPRESVWDVATLEAVERSIKTKTRVDICV
ncbi:MAG: Gfo/Idh/MocA family oxidoreductase [Verrucomicrobiae bacterium]|nr:Gfo/Idh/MocA family oxidoreductase [Verrucomicrobiae bacterium]